MRKIISTSAIVIALSLNSLCPASAETSENSIQDTARAAQYFEDELNFKTWRVESTIIFKSSNQRLQVKGV